MIRRTMILAAWLLCAVAFAALREPSTTAPDFIAAAVADPNRPATDKDRDANRKPVETLEFAGVMPGDQVAELLPGGGYFTRLFSKVVGNAGHVYALVPAPSPNAPATQPDFAARVKALAADPNYANVSVVVEPFNQLKTPVPVDLVWTSQNYHDLHNFPGLDIGTFNRLVFEALKPGGLYIILEHPARVRRRPPRCTESTRRRSRPRYWRRDSCSWAAAMCCSERAIRTRPRCSTLAFAV